MTLPRPRLLVAAICAAAALPLAGASPAAAATCKPGKYPGQGYFTSLKVSHISCSGGRDVMRAHYRCRTRNGIKGRCPSFNGWRCTERRQAIATEYNARVTCRKGSRTVIYTYQQNT
jgi:hypothetical protein